MRTRFEQQLQEIQTEILQMGDLVASELRLAMQCLEALNVAQISEVEQVDGKVNRMRYDIDTKCVMVISTQQPTARDLRTLIAALNIIVDLERMGDHAKNIAQSITYINQLTDSWAMLPELQQMSQIAHTMLQQGLQGYRDNNVTMIKDVVAMDNEVDDLFAAIFKQARNLPAPFETLRIAQDIERFADRVTNIAERVVYAVEGDMREVG